MVIQRADQRHDLSPSPIPSDEPVAGGDRIPEEPSAEPSIDDQDGFVQGADAESERRDALYQSIGTERPTTRSVAPEDGTLANADLQEDLALARRGAAARGNGRARRRLDYDTAGYRLTPLNVPTTEEGRTRMRTRLSQQLDTTYGAGNWSVNGAAEGSAEELRAMHALSQYGRATRGGQRIDHRNTESDLLVPGRGSTPPMRMTTQTNGAGQITANVHGTSGVPQPARTFATAAEGRQALQRDFGVTVARRDSSDPNSREFSAAELSQAHHAFSQMSADERRALRGVELRREANPPAGEDGDTTGLYESNVATRDGQRVRPPSITLYDGAFDDNGRGFVGSDTSAHPNSTQTILHEAGHAVENHRLQEAQVAVNQAVDRQNDAAADLNAANAAYDQPRQAMDDAGSDFTNSARSTQMNAAERRQAVAYQRAANGVVSANNAVLRARTPAQLTRARSQLQTAVQRRDRALTAMGAGHPLSTEATDLQSAQNTAIAAAGTAADRQIEYQQAVGARRTADRALSRVQSGSGESARSARLASFDRALRRDVSPTEYGRTSVAEKFAESYMLYRSDPEYLRTQRPNTYRWFQQNNHTR